MVPTRPPKWLVVALGLFGLVLLASSIPGPFLIDDALYEGIPEAGTWTVTGVVRAQDPPLLLPRGPGDLVDAGGDTGAL